MENDDKLITIIFCGFIILAIIGIVCGTLVDMSKERTKQVELEYNMTIEGDNNG